jgi:phenylalanyl-tRNA synthetase beta chain
MPTIHINKKVFEKLVGKKLPEKKLMDRISYLGTDLDEVGEEEIVVEIFPNRPDMLSVQGFSRAFSSFIGVKKGLCKFPVKKSTHKVIVESSVKKYRPYTACAIVKNLSFDDEKIKEIVQLQEKLHVTYGRHRKKAAIGIYPFEKIKTPIRFMALKPKEISFIPLESSKEMNGIQILNNHPTGREYAHLLDGLDKYPIFIDANDEILSMPPVINSEKTGKITDKTKDVFVECSGFDYPTLSKCLNMIVTAMADMGGTIYSMDLNYGNKKRVSPELSPEKMDLNVDYVNKRLGLNLTKKDCTNLLKKMGYGYSDSKVLVPAYRTDVMHQADLAEDIAIAYGYDKFSPEIPNVATIGKEDDLEVFKKRIANCLVGFGLLETSTYHLTNKKDLIENMSCKTDAVELEKASSTEYNLLRTWMIPSLMQVLASNKHHEYPQKLFEIGTVFLKNPQTESGVEEASRLAVVSAHKSADYTELKQMLDYLLSTLGLKYSINATEHSSFIPGRVGRVVVNKTKTAYIGELSPEVLSNFGIEIPASAFELNISELFKILNKSE